MFRPGFGEQLKATSYSSRSIGPTAMGSLSPPHQPPQILPIDASAVGTTLYTSALGGGGVATSRQALGIDANMQLCPSLSKS